MIFLIDVFDTAYGEHLSPAVADSVEKVCNLITSLIQQSAQTPHPSP